MFISDISPFGAADTVGERWSRKSRWALPFSYWHEEQLMGSLKAETPSLLLCHQSSLVLSFLLRLHLLSSLLSLLFFLHCIYQKGWKMYELRRGRYSATLISGGLVTSARRWWRQQPHTCGRDRYTIGRSQKIEGEGRSMGAVCVCVCACSPW